MPSKLQRIVQKLLYLLCAAGLLTGAAAAEPITVFAASSLRDAVEEMAEDFEAATGADVVTVYAASSALARQVALGAPADVVLLADRDWADWLVSEGVVSQAQDFASNRLVLLTRDGQAVDDMSEFPDILDDGLLAMAQIEAVPAGRYGRQALGELGLWSTLEARVIQAANVRAALRFVDLGEATYGIGYASDLVAFPTLVEAYAFPTDSHIPITYAGAAVTMEGAAMMAFVLSPDGQSVLARWGFLPPPEGS